MECVLNIPCSPVSLAFIMILAYLALCILLVFVLETTAIAHALICCPLAPRDDASQGGITKSTIVDMIVAVGTTSNIESCCRHAYFR